MAGPVIRAAHHADAEAVAAIYAHHVLHGTASFDTEPPLPEVWNAKIALLSARGWPFLVSESEGLVNGFAYSAQFRDRPAYAGTCEDSIYVDHRYAGQGIGSALLAALIDAAREAEFEQMIAVIGGAEPASVALHTRFGFVEAGRMRNVGRKFGRLLDTLYMQRDISG
jgi:L-amino acid N-acyltransferase YncA